MTSLWSTHVIEPGKTYDELDDTIKRPFEDDTQGVNQQPKEEKMNEHVLNTVNKYLDHINAGGRYTRKFLPEDKVFLIFEGKKIPVKIVKQEDNDVFYNTEETLKKIKELKLEIDTLDSSQGEDEEKNLEKSARLQQQVERLESSSKCKGKKFFIYAEDYFELMAILKDEEQYLKMQQNKTYQFVMLLASYTNEKIVKFFDAHDGNNVHTRLLGASGSGVPTGRSNKPEKLQGLSKWYHNIEWADGLVHLAPMLFGHIEEAYTVIKQKWPHLKNAPLNAFTDSLDVRSMFARLVSMGIRTSDVLSGRRYHLQSTYSRVNMEKMRLLNYWHKVHYNGRDLVYDPQKKTVDQMSTISQVQSYGGGNIFAYTNAVQDMNTRRPDRLKDIRNYL